MRVDAEIKTLGFEVLTQHLGLVDAERFITLILREKFDYTTWRQTLFPNMSGEEISRRAMAYVRSQEAQPPKSPVTQMEDSV